MTSTRYSYEIVQAEYADNPRECYDNLSLFVFSYGRYDMPNDWNINFDDFDGWQEVAAHIKEQGGLFITPVYAYEHGGITISTGKFSCQWDSGCLGLAFTTKEKMKEIGTPDHLVEEAIKDEVKLFDMYLQGDAWIVYVKDTYGDGEDIDSSYVWGHLEAEKYAKEITNYHNELEPEQLAIPA